jgi:NADH-quinone oxidoreductase subunit M
VADARDLRPREWAVLIIIIALVASIGLYPIPWLEIVRPSAEAWAAALVR